MSDKFDELGERYRRWSRDDGTPHLFVQCADWPYCGTCGSATTAVQHVVAWAATRPVGVS